MDEIILMTIILVIVNGAFDAVVVAYLAGRRSKEALTKFLDSAEADSYYEKIAKKAEAVMMPTIDAKISTITSQMPKPNYSEIRILVREEIERIEMPEMPKMPDIPPMPDMEALRSAILSDLNEQLNLMMPAITETVQTALAAEYKAVKAAETRKLGQELEKYGLGVNEMGDAMRQELTAKASEGMTPMQISALNFLQRKPSPAWAEENPGGAAFLEFAKMIAIQYAQGDGLPDLNMSKPINAKKAVSQSNSAKSGIYG